mmetsp:Transcript_38936/g.98165  ORF Transcript_38936/g.98165 Transcript_38936/m.98165 type:complete len:236 (-) Transcript_38936:752-1459(-)
MPTPRAPRLDATSPPCSARRTAHAPLCFKPRMAPWNSPRGTPFMTACTRPSKQSTHTVTTHQRPACTVAVVSACSFVTRAAAPSSSASSLVLLGTAAGTDAKSPPSSSLSLSLSLAGQAVPDRVVASTRLASRLLEMCSALSSSSAHTHGVSASSSLSNPALPFIIAPPPNDTPSTSSHPLESITTSPPAVPSHATCTSGVAASVESTWNTTVTLHRSRMCSSVRSCAGGGRMCR